MTEAPKNTRRTAWTPPPRPEWVARVNEEGRWLDMKGVVPLDAESLIARAKRNTGLSDFGSEDWREPFEVICRSLDEEADLTLMGRIMTRQDMLMLLEGRLEIEEAYRLHPEIEDEEIVAPILITGQGRTGTSAMINLLAHDPGNAVTQTWHALFPGLPRHEEGADPRIAIADERMKMWVRVAPEMAGIHEWAAEVPTESIHVMCLAFQSPAWQAIFGQNPSHYAYMAGRSMVPAIAYEKRLLKLLQWQNPGKRKRWVLKSPDALNYLPDVLKVYPDVGLVWMHRDPVKALSSAVSLVGTLAWTRSDRVLSAGTFDTVADPVVCARMLSRPIDWIESGVLPKERILNLQYEDFIADAVGTAESIYRYFHHELTPGGRAAMQRYMEQFPRSSRPKHQYATGEKGQVSAERQAFRRYQDYFRIPNEV